MAPQELTQAEVWDDSSLLDSWNEALEEYKNYHSLAAKGEKVKLELEEPQATLANGDVLPSIDPEPEVTAAPVVEAKSSAQTVAAIPQALLNSVQNEDMKNLMMSWYYAGYYTGLYEGKQQGYASAMGS